MAENQGSNDIIESAVEKRNDNTKSSITNFRTIQGKKVKLPFDLDLNFKRGETKKSKFPEGVDERNCAQKLNLVEDCSNRNNTEKCDPADGNKISYANESKPTKGDGVISKAEGSKPAEDDGIISEAEVSKPAEVDGIINETQVSKPADSNVKISCAKESQPVVGGGKISKAEGSTLTEGYGKISKAEESKPSEEDGKINETGASKPAECDGTITQIEVSELPEGEDNLSNARASNAAKYNGDSCNTENFKHISISSEGNEKSIIKGEENLFLSPSDFKGGNVNMKSSTLQCFSTYETKYSSKDYEISVKVVSPNWKPNLGNMEKEITNVQVPEFYKLGLIGSPEMNESHLRRDDKSPIDDLVLDSSSEVNGKPEIVTCFNWFKKVNYSPQTLISRFRKYTNPKASNPFSKRPMISSECHADDSFKSPGLSPIENSRHFVLAFLGNNVVDQLVDRIDYSKLAEDKIIPAFLGMHPCYDVMPTSGKVIVLSVELLVKNAFSALVTNEIRAAPLWDTGLHDFIGMLTISDFINVLRHYFYSNPEDIKDIENQTISTWRKMTKMSNEFIKINGSDSLAQATKLLIQEGVHRIPVFDEKRKCVLFVLTRKRLLQYLSYSLFEKFEKSNIQTPSFFRKTLRELQVGTYENIATTTVDGRVIDALDLFVERKVSSLPVVDENGELKDIFEKFDVFALAKEQTYHNLEMTVLEAITKAGNREGAVICTLDESLGTVINKFVNSKVHRIVVINERRIVIGIVSLSDVLKFLVVQPLVSMEDANINTSSDIIEEGAEGAVGGSDAEISVFDSGEQDSSASLLTEESDKNNSSLSEGITDLKISSAPEDPEENLDGEVPKSE